MNVHQFDEKKLEDFKCSYYGYKIGKLFKRFKKYLENKGVLYKTPLSMGMEDWESWRAEVKAKHPVQYWLRDEISSYIYRTNRRISDFKYKIKSWFFPAHPIVRKALKREWQDITSLIIDLNFALILQFKEEADAGIVDWEWQEGHKNFKTWLDASAVYIKEERPKLLKQQDVAYPSLDLPKEQRASMSYEDLYGEVNRIEALIDKKDSEVIKGMVDNRSYFWT